MLRDKLDKNEIVVNELVGGDVSHLALFLEMIYSIDFYKCEWERRPKHGYSKGHTYMDNLHKTMVHYYFEAGEVDKGEKKFDALMVEAMSNELG